MQYLENIGYFSAVVMSSVCNVAQTQRPTRKTMIPAVNIYRLGLDEHRYAISIGAGPAHGDGNVFESLEECLRDAGSMLSGYFSEAELHIDGHSRGTWPTRLIERDAADLLARLEVVAQPA